MLQILLNLILKKKTDMDYNKTGASYNDNFVSQGRKFYKFAISESLFVFPKYL